jgi:hypothetical protein
VDSKSNLVIEGKTNLGGRSTDNDGKGLSLDLLTTAQQDKMRSSKRIRSLLKCKRLRTHISMVDSAPSDEQRSAALKRLRSAVPEFNDFVIVMLEDINGNDNDGPMA